MEVAHQQNGLQSEPHFRYDKAHFFDVHDTVTRKILYLAHVRPILEYGSEVWNPHAKGLNNAIEKDQRRATKFILRSSALYEERLKELHLLSLEDRRKIKDNVLFFKDLQSLTSITI